MERKNVTVMITLDLSVAFDTVNQEVLLSDLWNNFGISGRTLEWFKNYITPRDMTVKIGKSYSERKELTFSVPQGSCSGANLFNMYSSTIREVVDPWLNLLAYADHHAIIKELDPNQAMKERYVIDQLTENLTKIKDWMNSVKFKMNISKLEFIIFGNRTQVNKCASDGLRIEGEIVNRSQIVKYLDAWLDSDLTLKRHVTKKCACTMLNLQRIKNIWKFLTRDSCMKLVVSLCLWTIPIPYCMGYQIQQYSRCRTSRIMELYWYLEEANMIAIKRH